MTEPEYTEADHEHAATPMAGKYLEEDLQEGISQDVATDDEVE